MGLALVAQGRLAEAIEQYRLALQMQPDFPSAHGNLGLALTQTGRLAQGEEHLRRALVLAPDVADIHGGLAVLQLAAQALEGGIPINGGGAPSRA
jgi:protein O-GlcNAc transferase